MTAEETSGLLYSNLFRFHSSSKGFFKKKNKQKNPSSYFEGGGRRVFGIALERLGGRVEAVRQPAAHVRRLDEDGVALARVARVLRHLRQRVSSVLRATTTSHPVAFNRQFTFDKTRPKPDRKPRVKPLNLTANPVTLG